MPKNETSNPADVEQAITEARDRVAKVKTQFDAFNTVVGEAKMVKRTLIADAEKVYGERYEQGRDSQQAELSALDEAYGEARDAILDRWSTELDALSAARNGAVQSASEQYDETVTAARVAFRSDS